MFHDYYKILGVPSNASQEEIKKAYRLKAKTHHPDVNKSANAGQNFALISEAYDILTDEDKRYRFDLKFRYGQPLERDRYRASGKDRDKDRVRENEKENKNGTFRKSRILDMKESHPVLFHLLFIFGMFAGFVLTILSLVGTYLRLWPGIFVITAIPGIILIIEGFKGITRH